MPNVKFYYEGRWHELYGSYLYHNQQWKKITSAAKIFYPVTETIDGTSTVTNWWNIKEVDKNCFTGYINNNFGSYIDRAVFTEIGGDANTDKISLGKRHMLMIKDNFLFTCGRGTEGQLGNGSTSTVQSPSIVTSLSTIHYISAGNDISFCIKDGNLYGCGDNGNNIFNSTFSYIANFTRISVGLNLILCDCCEFHCMSISKDGKLYGVGKDINGWIGLGNVENNYYTPTQITKDINGNDVSIGWEKVACGNLHTIGIYKGKLYAWGRNENYQLGTGDYNNRTFPTLIDERDDWTYVDCGDSYSCAMRGDKLYLWGSNAYGQIGMGTTQTYYKTPTYVSDGWDYVKCGYQHNVGKKYHDLYVWGRNRHGELGDGRPYNTNVTSPQLISGNYWWRMADAGEYITFGIRES